MSSRANLAGWVRLLVALWAVAPTSVRASGVHGVVMLRNGNLLEGTVSRSGDRYQVESNNSRLQVPARQVATFCRSKSEAYELLRRQSERPTANFHLFLAKWCLKHELLEQASTELLTLRSIDPEHAAFPGLERQLSVAIQQRDERLRRSSAEQAPAVDDADAATPMDQESTESARLEQTTVDAALAPAAYFEPAEQMEAPASIAMRDQVVTAKWQQPAASRVQLTDEARATFVRSIQPMLVHSCNAAGCHQRGGAQRWQLDRLAVTAGGHPTIFARNLDAVISQLHSESPSKSPLLLMAQRRHGRGGARSSPLNRRQIDLLAEWIDSIAAEHTAQTITADDKSAPTSAADVGHGATSSLDDRQTPPNGRSASDDFREPTFEEIDSLDWGTAGVKIGQPVGLDPFTPSDPFDPEIFNRQYGPNNRPPAAEVVTDPNSPPSK